MTSTVRRTGRTRTRASQVLAEFPLHARDSFWLRASAKPWRPRCGLWWGHGGMTLGSAPSLHVWESRRSCDRLYIHPRVPGLRGPPGCCILVLKLGGLGTPGSHSQILGSLSLSPSPCEEFHSSCVKPRQVQPGRGAERCRVWVAFKGAAETCRSSWRWEAS